MDFRIVILDNASECDYSSVLSRYPDPRITYLRHARNLGAAGNNEYARQHYTDTKYLIVFHDDDLMHPRYLEAAIRLMEQDESLVWIGAISRDFTGDPPEMAWNPSAEIRRYPRVGDFSLKLMSQKHEYAVHFGSIIFRCTVLQHLEFDNTPYFIYGDRPFLMEIARQGPCAVFRDPYILYRSHAGQDSFEPGLTADHVIALWQAYRAALQEIWNPRIAYYFYRKAAVRLLTSYDERLELSLRPRLFTFLARAHRAGVLQYPFLVFYLAFRLRIQVREKSFGGNK